ncbi:MAG: hypothetical protein MUP85_05255 [Candidatus Lokiarchaeota archaeon]|nr:hypothetical protein [Candidatus Lokiarchaeota archaeon]
MIQSNMEDILSNWEDRINFLSDHIEELESQLQYYQNLVAEKDTLINRLIVENKSLTSQGIVKQQPISTPSEPPQELQYEIATQTNIPPPNLHPPPDIGISPELNLIDIEIDMISSIPVEQNVDTFDSGLRKRQCPQCGAQGFAIREVEDKSRLISYLPHRIYAKKRVCIKCRNEF